MLLVDYKDLLLLLLVYKDLLELRFVDFIDCLLTGRDDLLFWVFRLSWDLFIVEDFFLDSLFIELMLGGLFKLFIVLLLLFILLLLLIVLRLEKLDGELIGY